jgi:hypothetical protein
VRLWDGATGASQVLVDDGSYADHVLAIDASGRWLALSPADGGRIQLYALGAEPLAAGPVAEHLRLVTPRGGVPCLAFVAGGVRLVSSSTTSPRLSVWDPSSGDEVIDLANEAFGLFGLDGGGSRRLYGLAPDGSLRVWDGEAR